MTSLDYIALESYGQYPRKEVKQMKKKTKVSSKRKKKYEAPDLVSPEKVRKASLQLKGCGVHGASALLKKTVKQTQKKSRKSGN